MADVSRWDRAWPALPYLFIALPALFSLMSRWRPEVAALAAFAAAWHWLMVASRFSRISRAPALIVHLAVLLAVVWLLIRIDGAFTVTGVGTFIQVFALVPGWWAYAGVAATVGVMLTARSGGRGLGELAFSFCVGVLIASTVGLLIRTVSRQNDQRKAMIAELEESGAKLAALAEENAGLQAQLLVQAREAGVLAERQRLAREIHDTIAQGLTAILTQLEAADPAAVPAAVRARLDIARSMAKESLTEARRSVQALRPAPLHEAQLPAALREVAAAWSRSTGVPVAVSVTGESRPLHAEVEITLLRVAQEAMANAGKHAGAARVGLTLSYMEDVVALDVRDDGRGFDPANPGHTDGGFGLVAMRQRVTRLAGDFAVETAPGQGTGISATVPAIPAIPGTPTGSAS
ncbi:sensor histidine kinase [Nonomuraea rosea]|uniref:Sensor histidine kinase n=2 Tax=Nonomuraea rosea TaxID=638574 RepID=A0ABP6YTF1_9ACTN